MFNILVWDSNYRGSIVLPNNNYNKWAVVEYSQLLHWQRHRRYIVDISWLVTYRHVPWIYTPPSIRPMQSSAQVAGSPVSQSVSELVVQSFSLPVSTHGHYVTAKVLLTDTTCALLLLILYVEYLSVWCPFCVSPAAAAHTTRSVHNAWQQLLSPSI